MTRTIRSLALLVVVLLFIWAGISRRSRTYLATTVLFSSSSDMATEDNIAPADTTPFMHIIVPSDWKIKEAGAEHPSHLAAPMAVYQGNTFVGIMGYGTLFDYAENENEQVEIHDRILSGAMANWNNEYTVITQREDLTVATCRIEKAANPGIYNQGVLAYDTELSTYIAIEVIDGALSNDNLITLTHSIVMGHH